MRRLRCGVVFAAMGVGGMSSTQLTKEFDRHTHKPTTAEKSRHKKKRLTAMERVQLFCDPGTFRERDALVEHECHNFGMEKRRVPGDGFVTGAGKVFGRPVFLFSHDFTVFGGSLSGSNAAKVVRIMEEAAKIGVPVIGFNN
ncbi:putative propionyl-coa carboxylase beta chain [Leishmania infantum JPCM5]|uniref:Propionyl-CoA carboxylase beta chain, mitochondrial n=1 Tax=Leishmania infantum TaxID=5671 RepID=A4I398_LEIIN|nr:putative propionyl-coa carboxylase beta chain [Leishmania infantum JPCM5]CAM69252.1 putative propionyl-coa carboxylase beta chain [Leishmania infantum JPCM5]|eukprot:XP_001470060.1 putative propionyl-coa carboxylase beta chain [Leishmania infantum JPCM5]